MAVFPGTLERLFGLDYDFEETWGVSQATFELFTLGTLAVLGVLGAVGYLRARPVRAERPRHRTAEAPATQTAGKQAAQL